MKTMIKKKMVAGGTKKSTKLPCPPFCGESAKEKLSTTSAKVATGVITAGAAAMGATGLAKRNKAIKAEQEKAKKEGKELTRREARKKVLGKASSGGTMKKMNDGGKSSSKSITIKKSDYSNPTEYQNAVNKARSAGNVVYLPKEQSPASWNQKKMGGAMAMKKYAAGSTTKTCPQGQAMVGGKCVSTSSVTIKKSDFSSLEAYQNAINAARKSGKTVVLPKEKSPASWTPIKKLGGVAVKKKMAAGGMSMGTKQCGPGDGSCKEVKSGNIFQRWGDKMRRNKANNFNKPKLIRTKV